MLSLDRQSFGQELNAAAERLAPEAVKALASLKNQTCPGAEFVGWFDWPSLHGFSLAKEIKAWREQLDVEFDLVVVIGIGGSYLGTRAVSDMTTHTFAGSVRSKETSTGKPMIVFAGHNMSETSLGELLELMAERKPLVNVISKSGTTTEPGVAFRVIRSFIERHYPKEAARRIIATTDAKKGALRRLATDCGYKTFEVPDSVGGRYSILTAVGLVPLALHGVDIESLLRGADRVFKDLTKHTPSTEGLLALQYAQCRTAAWENGKKIEVLSYPEPKMRNLAEWWKQLFGESDGKEGKGLFPASLECTMDLHSMGQYMQEGVRSMMETFLSVDQPRKVSATRTHQTILVPKAQSTLDELGYLEGKPIDMINQTAMKATRLAHSSGGVPCLEIKLPDLSPETLGALFASFETACAVGGLMIKVNPFNQPGVEAYKLKMFELLGKPSK
jgi:glucose-6-phosphate isomerase